MAEKSNIDFIPEICAEDSRSLAIKDREYGSSWKKRGGVGAFMMLARKWDRIENAVQHGNWDIFGIMEADNREEGILDDIRDLRRYLLLVESEIALRRFQAEVVRKAGMPPARSSVTGMQQPRGFRPEEES
jgi:hypothetical protein